MLMTLTPRISDGRTIVAVGAHGQLSSASGQCRRFEHGAAWSALPPERTLATPSGSSETCRQRTFTANSCLLGNKRYCPDPSSTRCLTGTCESLGLDRAFSSPSIARTSSTCPPLGASCRYFWSASTVPGGTTYLLR